LYAVWEQINFELAAVEKLLPVMSRQKGGLLNFGGNIKFFVWDRDECGSTGVSYSQPGRIEP
jgi:hypothetical protein